MTKKVNFTADRITGFTCLPGKKQSFLWDAKAPGLGLRATSTGAKSYIFESKLHGRTIRMTIGDVRTWALDGPAGKGNTARAEANRLMSFINQGVDPRLQKAALRARADADRAESVRHSLTLSEVWTSYISARKNKWGDRHYQDHIKMASAGGVKRKRGGGETIAAPLGFSASNELLLNL
jgi:hypothetical protein